MSSRLFSFFPIFSGPRFQGWRVGVCLLACLGMGGCNPYSEIRSELSPADQMRFDRGLRSATPCWSCHDLTGDAIKVGPPLLGLFGQQAGFVKGFPYSRAMMASRVVWQSGTLDRFLSDPQGLIPQNRMLSAPLADPQQRSDLIFFLQRVSGQAPGH
ncbi:MAG: c-type cytochrome [Myxococcota bacterium]|jgi:cytochrome c|nr:c-type cytochrome [Myxococcota bacterium]